MAEKITVEIVRAYWPDEDNRTNPGETITVEVDEALRLIEEGIAKRVEKKAQPRGGQ